MNGKSMGKQKTADFTNNTIIWNIPYRPGTLGAKGYNDGKEVAAYQLATSKDTDSLTLTPDRTMIKQTDKICRTLLFSCTMRMGNLYRRMIKS